MVVGSKRKSRDFSSYWKTVDQMCKCRASDRTIILFYVGSPNQEDEMM